MSSLFFSIPPMPHYLFCGEDTYQVGQKHPNRKNIGIFDLLLVTKGGLFIGEEQTHWEIREGHILLLRPDCYHFSLQPCVEETHFYWLHFQTFGRWFEQSIEQTNITLSAAHSKEIMKLEIPRLFPLTNPVVMYEKFRSLILLTGQSSNDARLQEQLIFQQMLTAFQAEQSPRNHSSVNKVAEDAATYLQQHYTKPLSYNQLGEMLNFHPTYISRCMKQIFGCTPLEYVNQFRIEQSKLHLLNSEASIGEIAEKVGFTNQAYFSRLFKKTVNQSPLQFRKQYR